MSKLFLCPLWVGLTMSMPSAAAPAYEKVYLTCANPGTLQTEAKKPVITNNTDDALNNSIRIFWTSSDGDKGYVQGPLNISASVEVSGSPGAEYTCEAFYYQLLSPTL